MLLAEHGADLEAAHREEAQRDSARKLLLHLLLLRQVLQVKLLHCLHVPRLLGRRVLRLNPGDVLRHVKLEEFQELVVFGEVLGHGLDRAREVSLDCLTELDYPVLDRVHRGHEGIVRPEELDHHALLNLHNVTGQHQRAVKVLERQREESRLGVRVSEHRLRALTLHHQIDLEQRQPTRGRRRLGNGGVRDGVDRHCRGARVNDVVLVVRERDL
mmetsp:Transcript_24326/g.56071  ORF Transcript_24326/g.56071 Transcript_24326/m.56071 type:complete len:215 (-) Transcript_24326:385-1029(-)